MRMASAGERRHYISLANPGPTVPDGQGGYTQADEPLSPANVYAQILPATARDLERLSAGTTIATATHIVRMPYHPGVTTQTVITYNDGHQVRRLAVTGPVNTEERNRETMCTAVELIA